jgi:tetratricopeptide (TPR) repeat protein
LQNYHRALEDFNQCLHLNPYQSETHYSRAQVYFHLGDYPKALSDCEQSLNIEPEAFQVQKFRELVRSYIHL